MRLIQEIGSYAGIVAIPGLAILSALYFSQARDVRRLRDWAGRAPERSFEAAQGGRVAARPAPQTAAAQTGAASTGVATPAAPATAAGAAAAGAAGGGGGTATATRPTTATPPGTHPPVPRVHAGGQTTILGTGAGSENGGDPWYRRAADRLPAARYLAIALVGVLVVGGGIAYGITQLSNDSSSSSSPSSQQSASGGGSSSKKKSSSHSAAAVIAPKDVSVAILNGTTVNGLASQVGTKLQQQGFQVGNEDNSLQGQVNESVVLFKPGATRKAALVRHRLDIAQIEPADQQSLSQSGGADVIVVIGADKAQAGTP